MSGSAIVTNQGLLKIASASPEDQLTVTQIAVGDGANPLDPNATGLVNEVYRAASSDPIRSGEYLDTLIFELNIPPTVGGFTVREIGAFDSNGDMIAVGTLDEVVKPTDGLNYTPRIYIKLQNAAQVDVFYDNQGAIDHSGLRNRNAVGAHDDIYTRNFKSVTDLKNQIDATGNVIDLSALSGSKIHWRGYYQESDGGSNWGIVKTGDSTTLTDDGGSIFIIVDDAVNGVWVESNMKGKKINVRKFGATEGVNSSPRMQAAIDFIAQIYISDGKGAALYAPYGTYSLDSTINLNQPGSTLNVLGDGTRNTVFIATSEMNTMFELGTSNEFYGALVIKDLTFDGNLTTDVLIDAKESRYITIENCIFQNFLVYGLIISKWTIKVLNNFFYGKFNIGNSENSDAVGIFAGLVSGSTAALNDVTIELNTFHKCGVGVELGAGANDVLIRRNSFDSCTKTGIYGSKGGGNLAIKNNYFERCGKTLNGQESTSQLVYPTTGESLYGAIILHEQQGSEAFGYSKLVIDDSNTFRNCSGIATMSISNAFDLSIVDNDYDEAYNTQTFVRLFGEGQGFVTRTVKGIISGLDDNIDKFVTMDANSANPFENGYYSNLVIQPKARGESLTHNKLIKVNDFMKFKGASQGATEEPFGTSTKFTISSPIQYDNIVTFNFDEVDIRGRYIKVMFGAKSTTETSNGVIVTSIIDGVPSSTGDKYESVEAVAVDSAGFKYLRQAIFYVPKELTTSWGFRVLNKVNAPVEMVQFAVFDAAIDPQEQFVFKMQY